MIKIELTQGKFALIDDEDFELISRYKWYFSKLSLNYGRVVTRCKKKVKNIKMHRLIMNAPDFFEVDHINGNTLDNRKINLRLVTHSQNQKNMKTHKDNKSGYKGVSWHKKAKKWQVHIKLNNKKGYLGLFLTKEEGALAYNKAALKHFGEFARLNEIKY